MKRRQGVLGFEDSVLFMEDPEKGSVIVIVRFPDGAAWKNEYPNADVAVWKTKLFVGSKGARAEKWMEKGWNEWLRRLEDERGSKIGEGMQESSLS